MPRLILANAEGADNIEVVLRSSAFHGGRVNVLKAIHTGSAYQIPTGFNTFILREATPASFTVTLPPGTYSAVSFGVALAAALNATAAVNTYACNVNVDTGLLSVTLTAGATNFAFWLTGLPRMAAVMGFAAANPAPAGVVLTGVFPVRLNPSYYLLVSPTLSSGATGPALTDHRGAVALLGYDRGRYTSQSYVEDDRTYYELNGGHVEFFLQDEFGVSPVVLNNGKLVVDLAVD